MATILLALASDPNASLLARTLERDHTISREITEAAEWSYDLCIVDLPVLKRHAEVLEAAKLSVFPMPLTLLLIIGPQNSDPPLRKHFPFIDEFIITPISIAGLQNRIEAIVRQKELFTELKARRNRMLRREIGIRRQRERDIQRLSRMLGGISQINHALLRVQSREQIFSDICRILIETAQVSVAWIGWIDEAGGSVKPMAVAGNDHGYLQYARFAPEDSGENWDPTSRAIGMDKPLISDAFVLDAAAENWPNPGRLPDWTSACSLPIHAGGEVHGALTIYGSHHELFTPELLELLKQATANIDFALDALERDYQRQVAEMKLMEAAERYRNILKTTKDAFWLVNSNGCLTDVNEAALAMTGYARHELIGKRVADIDIADAQADVLARFSKTLALGSDLFETQHRTRDGRIVDVEVSTMPDKNRRYVVAFIRDITERRQMIASLIEARNTAEEASQAKTRFLGHMSHELRTPLNAILGFAQLLEHEPLTPGQLEMASMIRESGGNLLRIIEDILDIARIERGKLQLELEPFAPIEMLNHIERQLSPLGLQKRLALRMQLPSGEFGVWLGYPKYLNQVLINLIGNAIKFTECGEVTVTALPRPNPADRSMRLRVEIHDTGIGIAPEVLPHLFQPFSQADATITRRFGGTGLGLAISKQLVELMGGQIGVNSALGKGSTFWLDIPLQPAESIAKALPAEAPVSPVTKPQELSGLHILAVDDNTINLRMIERALSLQGATVAVATDGAKALEVLRKSPKDFDMVLMDIQMPVMDGLTATREIRNDPALARQVVIALTAGVLPEEREAAIMAGVDDFLTKPLDLGALKMLCGKLNVAQAKREP